MAGFSVPGYGPERTSWTKAFARDSVVRRLDWPMLLSALALSLVGVVLVYSATRNRMGLNQGDPYFFFVRHLLNTGIGIALMAGTIWLGHRTLRTAVPVLYGISVLLILLVLTPLGATINGAHAWLVVGGFSLQPSEFVKITIILGMAMLLAARVDAGDREHPDHRTVLLALALATVPMLIVMLMPDLGSVMVMVMIVLGVLLTSGASNRWILGLIGAGPAGRSWSGSSASWTSTRSTGSPPSPTPSSTPRASATTPTRPASPSAPAGSPAPASSRAPRPPASSSPSSRPTSSSPSPVRNSASSAPASSSLCSASSSGAPAASPAPPPSCTAPSSPAASSPGSPSSPSRTSA